MDYVLFGMGYGASLMLLGWALRTYGPQLKYARPPQEEDASFLVEQRFWVRFIQGLGGVIAIAGTTMVLLTFVVVLVNPDDATGNTMALAIWIFIVVVVLIWCGFYLKQFGLTGIWSREQGYGLRKSTSTSLSRTLQTQTAAAGVQPKKRFGPSLNTPEVEPDSIDGPPSVTTVEPTEETVKELDTPDALPEASTAPEPETERVYDFGDGSDTTVPSDESGRAAALRRLQERQARSRQSST